MAPTAKLAPADPTKPDPYTTRPVRPVVHMGARLALWGAVGIGCLGGLVGLLRPSAAESEPVVAESDAAGVPGPVAGMAERVVRAWLTATARDQEDLQRLFVDPPAVGNPSADQHVDVGAVTAVAGRRVGEGYWAVTVSAEVVDIISEEVEETAQAAGQLEDEEPPREATWYLDVGIVGEVDGGLAALTAPAVMPGPPAASSTWRVGEDDPPEGLDEASIEATVLGLLTASLTGNGDPGRYVAPGVEISAASPAPFVEVTIEDLSIDQLDDGRLWVLAQVLGTTRGGVSQAFTYDMVMVQRVDRWEVLSLSGVPTLVREVSPEQQAETTTPDTGTGTGSEGDASNGTGTGTGTATTPDTGAQPAPEPVPGA